MKYYIAEGPIKRFGYEWTYSYYKVFPDYHVEATRFYPDGSIVNDVIQCLSTIFIKHFCKEITREEYELMLEL